MLFLQHTFPSGKNHLTARQAIPSYFHSFGCLVSTFFSLVSPVTMWAPIPALGLKRRWISLPPVFGVWKAVPSFSNH